jgi:signal transduction histidine kinase
MFSRHSLQATLMRVQMATVLIFLAGATVFGWRMTMVDLSIEDYFNVTNRLRLLRHVDDVAVLTDMGMDEAHRLRLRSRWAEDLKHVGVLDPRTEELARLAGRALQDPQAGGPALRAKRAEIAVLHQQADGSTLEAQERYRSELPWVAIAWSTILVLPLVLAWWPLRLSSHVIDGIGDLGLKVEVGRRTGDSRAVPIQRSDEIGALGLAIDEMFADLRRREAEARLARQLEVEQQKLADIVSLTGGILHEVANPLSVILANLDCLQPEPGGDGHATITGEELGGIREGLHRIQTLLRHVMEMSSGDDDIGLVDVNSVVSSVFRIIQLDDRVRSNRFSADLDPALPAVPFSRRALTLVTFSLLSLGTAVLREHKGTFAISTRSCADTIKLCVTISRRQDVFAEQAKDPFLELPEIAEYSTLCSLIRVVRSYGGDLLVFDMSADSREFQLLVPSALNKGDA